ncbi:MULTISPECIES: YitT family protein [Peptoniphilus]|jgi:putative membrane protein|uniref:YitT family protein n=1 Tax=Peptoniphilus TaxID=162289 RepID=UPI000287CCB7|nr:MULTISPECIES: YitT family protein [Peptoniphilus]MDU1042878.1 YitT family protein [Peptoniphilus rhinitidis]MDU1954321.1 YitT family protein [Peptoniphilus lacydonensis]MDU2109797.1 YitT family protein [Peptoniphilus lacydonensis]MDU3751130.1 YitT family protein [Peptoniphilus rhinitidis]MDU5274784.1 YitT family protein [Peptoniphilus lacydonensis]
MSSSNLSLKSWIFSKTFARKLFSVILCNIIAAFSITYIIKPNLLISGGLTGLSILISNVTGLSLPMLVFVLNIPTSVLSFFFLDRDFTFFSTLAILLLSMFISFYEKIMPNFFLTKEPILACIFGGLLNGIGAGIAFRSGTSTGGLDIIAAILKKKFNITIGNVLMGINFIIVSCLGYLYTIDKVLFTLILMFINYSVIDRIQLGVGKQKQVLVISEKNEEISRKIHEEIHRGSTYIKGVTSYKKKNIYILYVVCSSRQLVKVRQIIKEEDPEAFVSVSETSEILGNGFKALSI